MKRMVIICLAAVLALSTAGCGSKKNNATTSSGSSSASMSSGSSDTMVPPGNTSSGDPVNIMIKDPKLKEAYDAVRKEFGEFYISAPVVVTEQQMTETYYVNAGDVEEFVGEMSMANISGDTFIAAKAKPGKAQAVADALEKRKNDIVEQFRTYPVNFMDLKSQAATVITEGDYVFLVLMGNINVPDGTEASLQMAQDEVMRAEKAIRSVFSGTASTGSSTTSSK